MTATGPRVRAAVGLGATGLGLSHGSWGYRTGVLSYRVCVTENDLQHRISQSSLLAQTLVYQFIRFVGLLVDEFQTSQSKGTLMIERAWVANSMVQHLFPRNVRTLKLRQLERLHKFGDPNTLQAAWIKITWHKESISRCSFNFNLSPNRAVFGLSPRTVSQDSGMPAAAAPAADTGCAALASW